MVIGIFAAAAKWLLGSFFGKVLLSVGLSLISSLIAAGLSRPPVRDARDASRREPETSLDGNVLRAGSPIPRVLGSQRLFPPLLAEPLVVFEAGREVVEGVFALSGPHDLEDVRIAGAPASEMPGVEVDLRDGTRRRRGQRLIRRYGFTDFREAEMIGPTVGQDGVTLDLLNLTLDAALPQPQLVRKAPRADELWFQLVWTQGLHREGDETIPIRLPLRLRARPVGTSSWRNLPELHFRGRAVQVMRATVRLIWTDAAVTVRGNDSDGFCEAFAVVPEAVLGSGGGWTVDATFDTGSGDANLTANNGETTRLRRIQIDQFEARFYLDPDDWPPGEWEVEIIRGAPLRQANFNSSNYQYSSNVRDFFGWYGTPPRIPESRAPIQDGVTLVRAISVVNETPSPDRRLATIAIRARGVRIEKVTVLAHGLVRRWEGNSSAPSFSRSDNPADLFRDVLASPIWAYPVLPADFDLPAILDWRARCEAEGWRCNAVIEDTSLAEVLRIICGAGYARPRLTGQVSVIQDYDRSAEDPVHIFTPRNSAGLVWQQARNDLPSGLRVTFRDRENEPQELLVWASEGAGRDPTKLETVEYESVQTADEARARANYDLRVGRYRRAVYALEAPPAAMSLLPGSLVGVVSDSLSEVMAAGVIVAEPTGEFIQTIGVDSGGAVYTLVIDEVETAFYVMVPEFEAVLNSRFQSLGLPGFGDATVMGDLTDLRLAGHVIGVSVQQEDGSWETWPTEPVHDETNALRLVGAPSDALRVGAEVAIGVFGRPERMVIAEIAPAPDLSARIVMLPDASAEIWGA
jgi:hypothetical protein